MRKKILIFCLCCFTFINIFATQSYNTISTQIKEAMRLGDITTLTEIMNSNIEVSIAGRNNNHDVSQVKNLLNDFFSKNRPNAFQITHKTEKDKSGFIMGKLHTDNGIFNIHILLQKSNSTNFFIYQLRIEKSND